MFCLRFSEKEKKIGRERESESQRRIELIIIDGY